MKTSRSEFTKHLNNFKARLTVGRKTLGPSLRSGAAAETNWCNGLDEAWFIQLENYPIRLVDENGGHMGAQQVKQSQASSRIK